MMGCLAGKDALNASREVERQAYGQLKGQGFALWSSDTA